MASSRRDLRFELLRIISMYIIILHHLILHVAINSYVGISFNRIVSQLFLIGGKVGVNCFLLISGYFGVKTSFKLSKAVRIELQVVFYTILSCLICMIVSPDLVSIKSILQAIMPSTFSAYWYVTAYMALLLVTPFINFIVENTTKRHFIYLLVILFYMESISPTLLRQRYWASDFVWFVFVYLIGAFIKKYEVGKKLKSIHWTMITILMCTISWGISVVLLFASEHIVKLQSYVNVFSTSNYSVFMLFISISLFMVFATMNPIYGEEIRTISKTTLGIYLIQSNPLISSILWTKIFKLELHLTVFWPFYAILISLIVFTICFGIELMRIRLGERIKILSDFVQEICGRIDMLWMEDSNE